MAQSEQLPHLDWLRVYEACARLQNFTAAGSELGVTQATVSQQIRALEDRLGVRLFVRLRRGVTLTAEGAAYLPHVQSALQGLARSTAELFGGRRQRMVALRSPISFAALWLGPRLAAFRERFPGVGLDLRTVHLPSDYAGEGEGLDIRFGHGGVPGRNARRLTAERLVPAAAPALLESLAPGQPWRSLPVLSVSGAREMWPDWLAHAGEAPSAAIILKVDSYVAAHEAAKAGAGVVLASRPLADRDLTQGRLVKLSTVELAGEAGHFVTWPSGASLSALEQDVVEWLHEATTGHATA
jgi:DNA-binding transcriptional LysR family regulator